MSQTFVLTLLALVRAIIRGSQTSGSSPLWVCVPEFSAICPWLFLTLPSFYVDPAIEMCLPSPTIPFRPLPAHWWDEGMAPCSWTHCALAQMTWHSSETVFTLSCWTCMKEEKIKDIFLRPHSIVYMFHNFFIHSSVSGYLGCFHVLATVDNAAMSI